MDWAEQCEEKLTALLEGEEKILLLRLLNAENEISSTIALENFILGFRLGMRIAMESLGEDAGTIEEVYEPYLVMEGFIKRTPRGREVTPLAYKHLGLHRTDTPDLFSDAQA